MPRRSLPVSAAPALVQLFEQWTGDVVLVEEGTDASGLDLHLRLGPHAFGAVVSPDAGPASVEAALASLRRRAWTEAVPLVVVPYMTPAGAARCEAADVAWADLSGNAHLAARAAAGRLYVHVSGQPSAFETRGRPRNAFAPKSARLARLLLAQPGAAWTQKALAEASGLNAGHVSRLVGRLAAADLVVRDGGGEIRVPDPGRLLDAWAEGNAFRHDVVRGHLPGRSGEERVRRLVDALGSEWGAFTGLAAAWAYTGAAGFRSVDVYVPDPPVAALREAGFREDTSAPNVRLLVPDDPGTLDGARAVSGFPCVAPAQAYVDLRHAAERADELREALRPLVLLPPAA